MHGYHLFLVSNESGIATGEETRETLDATLRRTTELLKLPVTEIAYCPHQAHPVACWCHLPLPGLGALLIERHRLARRHLVVVGNAASDAEFAAALGATYWRADQFFGNQQ